MLIVAGDLSSAKLKATRLAIYRCEGWDPATRDEICDPDRSRPVRVSTEDATIFDGLDKFWSTCPPL